MAELRRGALGGLRGGYRHPGGRCGALSAGYHTGPRARDSREGPQSPVHLPFMRGDREYADSLVGKVPPDVPAVRPAHSAPWLPLHQLPKHHRISQGGSVPLSALRSGVRANDERGRRTGAPRRALGFVAACFPDQDRDRLRVLVHPAGRADCPTRALGTASPAPTRAEKGRPRSIRRGEGLSMRRGATTPIAPFGRGGQRRMPGDAAGTPPPAPPKALAEPARACYTRPRRLARARSSTG
jgi:hypothetical protein